MTSVWGSQQVGLFPGAKYDGVFGMWYGKGPGLDRSMDVLKHANAFGTSQLRRRARRGRRRSRLQVIHLAAPERSHVHRRHRAGTESGGRSGSARSRRARLGTVALLRLLGRPEGDHRKHGCRNFRRDRSWPRQVVIPDDYTLPEDGVHTRWPDTPMAQEERLQRHKIYAARAFARANNLNRIEHR